MVSDATLPREYTEWRPGSVDREEDAAYTFGHHLVVHCRDEAIARLPSNVTPEDRALVEAAVDHALHNVMDMLEGFWRLESGPSHSVEYILQVRVKDATGATVENLDLSPSKLDLPIGYWKWVQERQYR